MCEPLSGVGVDVKGHGFECYLVDLQGKAEVGKMGSSDHPNGA